MSNPDEPKKKPPQPTVAWDSDRLPEPTEDASPQDDPLVGQVLRGKWRVLSVLGAGSFGNVYKVKDEAGGWIEALKILAVDRITGSEAQVAKQRFLREAQIMKRLGTASAHIVGLSTYEEDLEAGLVYFLMEYVEGRSLADVVAKDGPLTAERTVRLALQGCEALIAAHEGPDAVVHRDLKLENLMLTLDRGGEEMIKVLDFGIAKLAEGEKADTRLTTAGSLGTPGYAAPEQVRAEAVDGRTDLFAYGVILYSLLTGVDPWLGNPATEPTDRVYDLMVATERAQVIPFSETGVDVPPALEQVVLRLLQRDPDHRFQSARGLRDALRRVQAAGDSEASAALRLLTEETGVHVQVRAGLRTMAEGATPCLVDGLPPGTYKVSVKDERFEPVETSVTLAAGALEDLELVTKPRAAGLSAAVRRRPGAFAAALGIALVAVGAVTLQPWGRTLRVGDLLERARSGGVVSAFVLDGGLRGNLALGPLSLPYRTDMAESETAAVVGALRATGLVVDVSQEVVRLLGLAARAQAENRYFGEPGSDVRTFAEGIAALDPASAEARSLLLKVAEHMAWDAEAAVQDGAPEQARALVDACLALVPSHPGCTAVPGGL